MQQKLHKVAQKFRKSAKKTLFLAKKMNLGKKSGEKEPEKNQSCEDWFRKTATAKADRKRCSVQKNQWKILSSVRE